MELVLYFVFVAVAVTGVALLLNALGQGKRAVYAEDEARSHLLTAYPEENPAEAVQAGGAVLFGLADQRIAIVRAMGRFPMVRIIAREDLAAVLVETDGIQLRTKDFSDPVIRLETEDADRLRDWIESRL